MRNIKPTHLAFLFLFPILFGCQKHELEKTSEEKVQSNTIANLVYSGNQTSISINMNNGVPISGRLFGVNNDWRQINSSEFTTFEQSLEGINYQLLRFPGGWESEYYDWSTNTTPGWSKTPAIPGASIQDVKNSNPPKLSIVIPTVKAMNEQIWSSEWYTAIQQCKQEAEDAINLTGVSNISSIEIGNEWWLQWGGGVSRYDKVRKYAHIAKRIAKHIDAQFPNDNLKVLVNGDYTVPSEFSDINYVFGADLTYIDGLALHTYAGYDSTSHDLNQLRSKVAQCQSNLGKDYLSLSEWTSSKAYNNNKIYAEAANILVEHIYEQAMTGADEAAFWPPSNESIVGLGLFNANFNIEWPTAQIFKDMAKSFRGTALSVNDGSLRGVACQKPNGTIVVYVAGIDEPWTTVNLSVNGEQIKSVLATTLWEPLNPSQTDQNSAMTIITNPDYDLNGNSVSFNVNENSKYSIYKAVLELY